MKQAGGIMDIYKANQFNNDTYKLTEPLVELFAEIIIQSPELYGTMLLLIETKKEGRSLRVKEVVEKLIVNRKKVVSKGRKRNFIETETNVTRITAAKNIEHLEKMGLVYGEEVGRITLYYPTVRGEQVMIPIIKHYKEKLHKNEKTNEFSLSDTSTKK